MWRGKICLILYVEREDMLYRRVACAREDDIIFLEVS
jgi:hypothetical protein